MNHTGNPRQHAATSHSVCALTLHTGLVTLTDPPVFRLVPLCCRGPLPVLPWPTRSTHPPTVIVTQPHLEAVLGQLVCVCSCHHHITSNGCVDNLARDVLVAETHLRGEGRGGAGRHHQAMRGAWGVQGGRSPLSSLCETGLLLRLSSLLHCLLAAWQLDVVCATALAVGCCCAAAAGSGAAESQQTHHKAVLVGVVLVLVLGGQAQAGPVVSFALQAGGTHRPGHAATDACGSCCCHPFCTMCCCCCCYCGWPICTTNIPPALLLSVAADSRSRCWHNCCAADTGAAVAARLQLLAVIQCRTGPRR